MHFSKQPRSTPPFRLNVFTSVVTVLICCLLLPVAGMAQPKNLSPSPVFDLYKEGKFDAAASRGLTELLAQPWNHDLRLMVADSLQRIGKIAEAKIQLEALDGTTAAKEAKNRLNALQQNSAQTVDSRAASMPVTAIPVIPSSSAASPVMPIPSTPTPTIASLPTPVSSLVSSAAPMPAGIATPAPAPAPAPIPAATPLQSVAFPVTPSLVASQSVTTPSGNLIQLAPFQYIPPAGTVLPDQPDQPDKPKRSPAQQRIVDLNAAGDYQAAGTEGLALQAKENLDDELKLIFANSLAWTGRLPEATVAYQGLKTGKYANQANIGLANIDRWLGYDHRAAPVYRSVLALDPENPDALQGLNLASRELSPRTKLSYGGSNDSSDITTRSFAVNHRWRDSSGANIMEIETSHFNGSTPTLDAVQRDATFRYKAMETEYKPSFEVSAAGNSLYGGVGVSLGERPIQLEAGVVNWGRFTANPNAVVNNLSASHLGLQAAQDFAFGKVVGRIDNYGVSDGNTVLTTTLRLSSLWRPLGSHFMPLLGVETRDAKFNTPSYWSPAQGFGSVYAGLLGEWGSEDWLFYASGQFGSRLYGEAGNSWSWTAGGKYWVLNDVAISLNLWGLSNIRDNAPYRANTFSIGLEKLWK